MAWWQLVAIVLLLIASPASASRSGHWTPDVTYSTNDPAILPAHDGKLQWTLNVTMTNNGATDYAVEGYRFAVLHYESPIRDYSNRLVPYEEVYGEHWTIPAGESHVFNVRHTMAADAVIRAVEFSPAEDCTKTTQQILDEILSESSKYPGGKEAAEARWTSQSVAHFGQVVRGIDDLGCSNFQVQRIQECLDTSLAVLPIKPTTVDLRVYDPMNPGHPGVNREFVADSTVHHPYQYVMWAEDEPTKLATEPREADGASCAIRDTSTQGHARLFDNNYQNYKGNQNGCIPEGKYHVLFYYYDGRFEHHEAFVDPEDVPYELECDYVKPKSGFLNEIPAPGIVPAILVVALAALVGRRR